MISKILKHLFYCLVLVSLFSCAERERANPLDPKAQNIYPGISLWITSHVNRIELSWNKTSISDFTGYYLYRQDHPDSAFYRLVELAPDAENYIDRYFNLGTTYSYYITFHSEDVESLPSNIVKTTPGPGYNWIVDKWGYQVVKTTYDARQTIIRYFTDWLPFDIAIDPNNDIALITMPTGREFVLISTIYGEEIASFNSNDKDYIEHPYKVKFESESGYFWVADSGGAVYRVSSDNYAIQLVDDMIGKPTDISFETQNDLCNIIDAKSKNIWRFNTDGTFLEELNNIGSYVIKKPIKFVIDNTDNKFWLIDRLDDTDYIYTGYLQTQQIILVDSLNYAREMCINPFDGSAWFVDLKQANSLIVQLSHDGIRQLDLPGFFNPYDLVINPYDGTLLVVDTGNYRLVHLNTDFETIGIYTNLNFPVRIVVE